MHINDWVIPGQACHYVLENRALIQYKYVILPTYKNPIVMMRQS